MTLASSKSARLVLTMVVLTGLSAARERKPKETPEQLRQDYISRLQTQSGATTDQRTLGSLWIPSGALTDPATDYKARNLNDTIVIQVSVATSAQQSGNVTSQRTFQTTSGISGLAGGIATHGTNPLLTADSSTQLKGQGQTAANSALQTSLTGTVIALLANGNMVVEAQRKIFMNNQHETVLVRGVVRPGDIGPNNTVASSALGNLEIEMKGKGIISDSTRPPNALTRAVLRLFGF